MRSQEPSSAESLSFLPHPKHGLFCRAHFSHSPFLFSDFSNIFPQKSLNFAFQVAFSRIIIFPHKKIFHPFYAISSHLPDCFAPSIGQFTRLFRNPSSFLELHPLIRLPIPVKIPRMPYFSGFSGFPFTNY